jgi:hypothetical protein
MSRSKTYDESHTSVDGITYQVDSQEYVKAIRERRKRFAAKFLRPDYLKKPTKIGTTSRKRLADMRD